MTIHTSDYIYAEPEERTVYVDVLGKHHDSREAALASNVIQDVRDHVNEHGTSNPVTFATDLLHIAETKPQMLRDFLECFEL